MALPHGVHLSEMSGHMGWYLPHERVLTEEGYFCTICKVGGDSGTKV